LIYGTGTIRGTSKNLKWRPTVEFARLCEARREGAVTTNYSAQFDSRGRF